ncbi:serine hydrolase [Streptomyces sp. VRA16 Mangrove soil]|uniref:serine hydrolase n=1 Tax=Streptomyces sp. VRA16 Mangrove soil TaxID=2817434 RepID=UPI001A9F3737|nr:serine hydrolase [Streptomyces sp. VRA16 Mangrove soil]MBO1331742.1 serine hydrolase [Streptomyces sp. VRA16 Mangrove soil]
MSSGSRRRRTREARRRPLLYAAVASTVLVAGTAATTVYVKAQAHDATALVSQVSTSGGSSVSSSASASPSPSPTVDRDALLAEALSGQGGHFSVAVLDVENGTSAAYASGSAGATYDTASIVKVDILATLLLQAQDDGRSLTAQEKTYATAMIENSDNASTTALWDIIGRADGLDAANERLGLTGTTGGGGPLWGLTQTTATDQLALLQQVFAADDDADAVLDADARTYVQGLMGNVEADQQWGISAAGDDGLAIKNGWLRRSTTGLWDINSVGRVTVEGKQYLVAVVSDGSATQQDGIDLVEAVAKAAVPVLSADA